MSWSSMRKPIWLNLEAGERREGSKVIHSNFDGIHPQDLAIVEVELRKALQDHQDPFCLYLLGIVLCDR